MPRAAQAPGESRAKAGIFAAAPAGPSAAELPPRGRTVPKQTRRVPLGTACDAALSHRGTVGAMRPRARPMIGAMAFLQSAPPRQPIFRAPAVVLWLIAALAASHAARVFQLPARAPGQLVYQFALYPGAIQPCLSGKPHGQSSAQCGNRPFPSSPIWGCTADWTHLAINCLWLLAFGPVVARRFGAGLFLVFFLVCGVAGAADLSGLQLGQRGAGDRRLGRHFRPDGGGLAHAAGRRRPGRRPGAGAAGADLVAPAS